MNMRLINQFEKLIFLKYPPNSLTAVKNNLSNNFKRLRREDAFVCLQNSYIALLI